MIVLQHSSVRKSPYFGTEQNYSQNAKVGIFSQSYGLNLLFQYFLYTSLFSF